MADYVEEFDIAAPADDDFLEQGDDSIRQLKRSIPERMETLVVSWNANPLVLRDGIVTEAAIANESITVDKLDPALLFKSMLLEIVQVTSTMTFPHGTYVHDFTVVGAEPGDVVLFSWMEAVATFVFIHGWVSAIDTVKVTIGNDSDSTALAMVDEPLCIIIIKPGRPGTLHGETLRTLTHTQFRVENPVTMLVGMATSQVYTIAEGLVKLYGTIYLPVGSVISGATIKVRSDGTATATGTLYKVNSGDTSLATFAATPGGGAQELDQAFSYTVAAGDEFTFVIELDSTGSGGPAFDDAALYWARIVIA